MISGTPLFLKSSAGTGAGCWRIDDVNNASNSATGVVFGMNTTIGYRQMKPGTVDSAGAVVTPTPSTVATGVGWNIIPGDMDQVSPNRRRLPSGVWTFNVTFSASTSDISANFGLRVHVYRRRAGPAYDFLGMAEVVNVSGVGAAAQQAQALNVTVATDVLFEIGETLHLEFWAKGRGGGATGLIAQTVLMHLGAGTVSNIALPGTGLRSNFPRTHPVTAVGTSTIQKTIKLPLRPGLRTTVTGTVAFTRRITATKVFAVTATGAATFVRRFVGVRSFANTVTGSATLQRQIRRLFTITATGSPLLAKLIRKVFANTVIGTPTVQRVLGKTATVTVVGTPTMARRVTAVRLFVVTASGVTKMWLLIPEAVLDRMEGGAPPVEIVKSPFMIFVDGDPAIKLGGRQYTRT